MQTQITTLSIFLLLLAFFIALNSLVFINPDKASPALQSLQETFAWNNTKTDPTIDLIIPPGQSDAQNGDLSTNNVEDHQQSAVQFLRDVKTLIGNNFPDLKLHQPAGRKTLLLRLPAEGFSDYVTQNDAFLSLFQTIIPDQDQDQNQNQNKSQNHLGKENKPATSPVFYLKIILHVTQAAFEAKTKSNQNALTEQIKKAASLTQFLQDNGIPPAYLSTGIEVGPVDKIDIYILVNQSFLPKEKEAP